MKKKRTIFYLPIHPKNICVQITQGHQQTINSLHFSPTINNHPQPNQLKEDTKNFPPIMSFPFRIFNTYIPSESPSNDSLIL